MPTTHPAKLPGARLTLRSPDATVSLGARLAPVLRPGDVIGLSGPLGAGKSLLARGILQARMTLQGVPVEEVPSPTFTLVQTYDLPGLEIWHADLYRLAGPEEAVELGLLDAFETAACLVEWPDRLATLWPADAVMLSLTPDGDAIRHLDATGPDGHPIIEALDG